MSRLDHSVLIVSRLSPGSWTHASSSLRKKIYVGSSPTIGIFLYVSQAVERELAVAFGRNYVGSSPTIGIFLYVAQAVERVLAVAFGKKSMLVRVPIFLYVAQAVERVLAVAFGNKLCWFKSHYWYISSCSPDSRMRASSSLRKRTMLVRVPLSAYFFM